MTNRRPLSACVTWMAWLVVEPDIADALPPTSNSPAIATATSGGRTTLAARECAIRACMTGPSGTSSARDSSPDRLHTHPLTTRRARDGHPETASSCGDHGVRFRSVHLDWQRPRIAGSSLRSASYLDASMATRLGGIELTSLSRSHRTSCPHPAATSATRRRFKVGVQSNPQEQEDDVVTEQPTQGEAVSFERDIKPLFRNKDRESMRRAFACGRTTT
jgi:hypothetical protein